MKNKSNLMVFVGLFVLGLMSRLVPHQWNFTLVGGVFLFAGSYFADKKISLALMLSTMLVSDAVLGFHDQMLSVYLAYAVMMVCGVLLGSQAGRAKILGYSFLGSLSFYVITNFAVWFSGKMYPMSAAGLADCYLMAIPFYKNQLVSDLASSLMLFELARLLLPSSKTAKAQ